MHALCAWHMLQKPSGTCACLVPEGPSCAPLQSLHMPLHIPHLDLCTYASPRHPHMPLHMPHLDLCTYTSPGGAYLVAATASAPMVRGGGARACPASPAGASLLLFPRL